MARIARLPHFAGVILACGCLIGMLGFGPRSGMGFLLTPMSSAHSWGRDVFALALAIQMLLWGAAQPFAGAIADRFGAALVLSVGAVLYALGLAAMAYAGTPAMLHLSAGVMIGFGLAGSSFTVVIGAFGKLMPPQWRSLAFGAGTAAGSFGQFLFSPLAVALIDGYGWQHTLADLRSDRASDHSAVARLCGAARLTAQRRRQPPGAAIPSASADRGVRPPQLLAARQATLSGPLMDGPGASLGLVSEPERIGLWGSFCSPADWLMALRQVVRGKAHQCKGQCGSRACKCELRA